MSARVVMYLLGNLCLLFINLIGHVLYNKHGDSNVGEKDTLCMFQYNSPYLKVHWSAMILPSVLLGLSPLVVMTTTLEFIAAQSPHFMKGLIIGLLFAIIGVFQMIGALALIPFSLKDIWSTTSMVQNPPSHHKLWVWLSSLYIRFRFFRSCLVRTCGKEVHVSSERQ